MVLDATFACPVKISSGTAPDEISRLLDGRQYTIVTSNFWKQKNIDKIIAGHCSPPVSVISDIAPNPRFSSIPSLVKELNTSDVIVAIGGGSVLDTAKALVALRALDGDIGAFQKHLTNGEPIPGQLKFLPIIAVPTTAGTGSEVTQWGTMWGDDGTKFSVNDPRLYPSHAVLDPTLTLTMKQALTIATGLDALSHACEAIWNKRHSPLTDLLAEQAIRTIHQNLETVIHKPLDRTARKHLQTASLVAGLALGTTQTALAHSISYPLTARFGIPHGIACSFTLGEVARYNMETHHDRLSIIASGLECETTLIPTILEGWMKDLGIGATLSEKANTNEISRLGASLINPKRAKNNIRNVDSKAANLIATNAFRTFTS